MKKLQLRVDGYMPFKGLYSTQNRVIISNSFLLSIFSFLQRFFLMSADMMIRVKTVISTWTIPTRLLTYDHLTAPTRLAGISQPRRDVKKAPTSPTPSDRHTNATPANSTTNLFPTTSIAIPNR